MVDAVGTTLYAYTSGGQLYTEDGPFASDTVTNGYSNELRVSLGLQQPTGAWTNGFSYDAAGRLSNVTSPAGGFGYGYTVNGTILPGSLVRSISLPNTASITNEYDPLARLAGTFLLNNAGLDLEYSTYGYNSANQRTSYTNLAGTSVQYGYDNIGQLKVATSSTTSENRGYAYDKGWNLSWLTNNGSASQFVVNTLNELTQSSTNYDSNGNLTNYANITYVYDDENRLTSTFDGVTNSYRSDFVYDGLGRLRKRLDYTWGTGASPTGGPPPPSATWHVSNVVQYIYDGYRVIQERDSNNVPLVSYTRGLDLSGSLERAGGIGGLLARSSGYSAGNWTSHAYYHADGGGNITCLVDANENIVASYRYDPYGNTISSSGSLAGANVYRFSSKECISSSGLYYYLFRFYAPNLQRWLNRDPSGDSVNPLLALARHRPFLARLTRLGAPPFERVGGPNLYEFGGNNPIGELDPTGLMTLQQIIEQIQQAVNEKNAAAENYWQEELAMYLEQQEAAAAAATAGEGAAGAGAAGAAGAGLGAGAVCAAAGGGLVVGVGGGLLLGGWEPYQGGGTVNQNVQGIFEGFWNWWYGFNNGYSGKPR